MPNRTAGASARDGKEVQSRIKIDLLLADAGWKLQEDSSGKANVVLEARVRFSHKDAGRGFVDYLLLDKDRRPLIVLEAKREGIDPLSAKEQAREYARELSAPFIILSNGNLHYLWDLRVGNPELISRFPSPASISQYKTLNPNSNLLVSSCIDETYVMQSQMPEFIRDPAYNNALTRDEFIKKHELKRLYPYQVNAIKALQKAVKFEKNRFLFEMATGTGKTLVSSAVIKLFLKSGNARRILFLVDRIELEDQAQKAFTKYLGRDYRSVIYKENRDSWANAEIVVTTIQTLLAGDRYRKEFSPTDFQLIISDEAHRCIGGNSRAVFEYFLGHKLGLTATPRNYLKGFDTQASNSQRDYERRLLLDTYKTFGCESGTPTFCYDLITGAQEGYLIQPIVVDARTEITAELLSQKGYAVTATAQNGEIVSDVFKARDYERTLFNEETNRAMCQAFLNAGLFDPIAQSYGLPLFGKSIVFCVSQNHAARVTNILNKLASTKWPEYYRNSDFAQQVTSLTKNAQQNTIDFSNNRLNGTFNHLEGYKTSKTRVVVTVGMMTTGYDCTDLLNIALMRPVFSPSDFIQMKGRGTRKNLFESIDNDRQSVTIPKKQFKLFDFFASCEYFEHEHLYDEQIKLPAFGKKLENDDFAENIVTDGEDKTKFNTPIDIKMPDAISSFSEKKIGTEGMRIDRESFKKAIEADIKGNETLKSLWVDGDIDAAKDFVEKEIFNRPKYCLNLDKIRSLFKVDRRINTKEVLEMAFEGRETFESKDELLDAEFSKFVSINKIDQDQYDAAKNFFKAYATDQEVRDIIQRNKPAEFFNCLSFDFEEYKKLKQHKTIIPQYIRDYAQNLMDL